MANQRMKCARKIKGEGWDTFEADWCVQIQRVDCPERGDEDLAPAFKNDREAIEHVIARARRGDTEAIDALWAADQDDLVHAVLWAQFLGCKCPSYGYLW